MPGRRIIKVRIPEEESEEPEYGDDSTPMALFLTFAGVANILLIPQVISAIYALIAQTLPLDISLYSLAFCVISFFVWGGAGLFCYGWAQQAAEANTIWTWARLGIVIGIVVPFLFFGIFVLLCLIPFLGLHPKYIGFVLLVFLPLSFFLTVPWGCLVGIISRAILMRLNSQE